MKPDAPAGHSRRVPADRDRPAGPVGQRASAAVRHGGRPVRAGAVGQSPDEEPQLGHLLQPDRPRSAARRHPAPRHPGALSGLRQHGRQAPAGRRSGGPVVRLVPARPARRQRHARPACQLPGQGVRPVLHRPGPEPIGLPAPRVEPAVVALARPARGPPRAAADDRPADRPGVVVGDRPRDRRVLQPGPDDAQLAQGEAGLRPLGKSPASSATPTAGRPTARAACWRAGWSRRACGSFRSTYSAVDRRQGQRRLGHARRQFQPAQEAAAADHRPWPCRP